MKILQFITSIITSQLIKHEKKMSNFKVEVVRESAMNISGKNVFYCHESNCLYWCDVLGSQILQIELEHESTEHVQNPQ